MAHDFGQFTGDCSVDVFDGRKVRGEKDVEVALEDLQNGLC